MGNRDFKMEHIYMNPQFGEDWFSYAELYREMVNRFPSGSHFVEIGSWKGKSSAYMAVEIANSKKSIQFDCIDPWPSYKSSGEYFETYKNLYETFLNNVEPVKDYINPIRATSMESVENYQDNSLDFVFIDGNHEYEYVFNDIKHWISKIKSGGVLSGHDYHSPEVINAVSDNNLNNIISREGCWFYEKS
jgi:predicted O-methyltransferase YrrM